MHRFNLFLCNLLSFKYLAVGWISARILKYYFYGVAGFDLRWEIQPVTIWMEIGFFLYTVIGWHGLIFFAAIGIDKLVGPIFFREEVAEIETILNTN